MRHDPCDPRLGEKGSPTFFRAISKSLGENLDSDVLVDQTMSGLPDGRCGPGSDSRRDVVIGNCGSRFPTSGGTVEVVYVFGGGLVFEKHAYERIDVPQLGGEGVIPSRRRSPRERSQRGSAS